MRINLKKFFQAINENLTSILDAFVLPYINNTSTNIIINGDSNNINKFKEFIEKYTKYNKNHKNKKQKKDLFNSLIKNCDSSIHAIRQFSK